LLPPAAVRIFLSHTYSIFTEIEILTMNQKPGEEPAHVSGQANSPMSAPAHALSFQQVAEELNANLEDGLTTEEAKRRLSQYGSNEFGEQEGVQPVKILLGQVANALTLVRCPITPP
jgi:Na+-exporting ATPase